MPETAFEAFRAIEIKTDALCPTCASRGRVPVNPPMRESFGDPGSFGAMLARDAAEVRAAHRPCDRCRPLGYARWVAVQIECAA